MQESKRILLDTSFLLPTMGIGVERQVYKALEKLKSLNGVELYYLEEGLMEALWVAARFLDKMPVEAIEDGVDAIRRDYNVIHPYGRAVAEAFFVYSMGHRDLIDSLHYATAKWYGLVFLTVDKSFIRFLERKGFEVEGIVVQPGDL